MQASHTERQALHEDMMNIGCSVIAFACKVLSLTVDAFSDDYLVGKTEDRGLIFGLLRRTWVLARISLILHSLNSEIEGYKIRESPSLIDSISIFHRVLIHTKQIFDDNIEVGLAMRIGHNIARVTGSDSISFHPPFY